MELVARIYEGATDPYAWPAIVERLTEHLGAPKGRLFTLLVPPGQGGLHFSHGVSAAAIQEWASRYIEHDLWAKAGIAQGHLVEGNVVFGAELVPEEAFLQSVIYREHLHKLDVARMCSGIIFDDRSPGVLPTVFSVFRGIRDAQFGTGERAAMRALLPHLSRALGVMFRLRDVEFRSAASVAALDSLSCGVALLDRRGRVVHLSRPAREMVRENDDIAVDHTGSMLAVQDPAAQLLLDKAIAMAIDRNMIDVPHFSRAVVVPRLSGRKPLLLQFAPLGSTSPFAAETGPLAAITFITEQDRAIKVDARTLKRLYQLTDAEIELAGRLCAGNSLGSAARHLGISASTAKSQLSAIFQKTATHRQAELVRLLISLSSHHT